MITRRLSWDAVAALFRSRGFPSTTGPLTRGCYAFHEGDLVMEGDFHLDDAAIAEPDSADRGHEPALGLIVDGDLVVAGNIRNAGVDSGPALVVFGDLRAANMAVAGSVIAVRDDVEVGCFHGYYNHGFLYVGHDLQAAVVIFDSYFAQVDGRILGHVTDRRHLECADIIDPHPQATLPDLLIDAVLTRIDIGSADERTVVNRPALFEQLISGTKVIRDEHP